MWSSSSFRGRKRVPSCQRSQTRSRSRLGAPSYVVRIRWSKNVSVPLASWRWDKSLKELSSRDTAKGCHNLFCGTEETFSRGRMPLLDLRWVPWNTRIIVNRGWEVPYLNELKPEGELSKDGQWGTRPQRAGERSVPVRNAPWRWRNFTGPGSGNGLRLRTESCSELAVDVFLWPFIEKQAREGCRAAKIKHLSLLFSFELVQMINKRLNDLF